MKFPTKKEKCLSPRDSIETVIIDSVSKAVARIEAAKGKPVRVYLKQHYTGSGFRAAVMTESNQRNVMPIMFAGTYRADSIGWDSTRVAEDALATYRNLAA